MRITSFRTSALIAFMGCLLKALMTIIHLMIDVPTIISKITDIVSMCLIGFFFISLYYKINWDMKR